MSERVRTPPVPFPVAKMAVVLFKNPAVLLEKPANTAVRGVSVSVHLQAELHAWLAEVTGQGPGAIRLSGPWMCIVCGRVTDRLRNMVRHAQSHIQGKPSAIAMSLCGTGRHQQHPVVMEVIRALHDHDQLCGSIRGNYFARAQKLLVSWTNYSGRATDSASLWTHMGKRDANLVLVITGTGPEYRLHDDPEVAKCKNFGAGRYCTMEFANLFLRQFSSEAGCGQRLGGTCAGSGANMVARSPCSPTGTQRPWRRSRVTLLGLKG